MASSADDIAAEIMAQIPGDPKIREQVRDTAARGASFARIIAPVYHGTNTKEPPGTFRDSIHDEDRPDYKGMPAARIISNDPAAAYIEYGTGKTPEHATFAKTENYLNASEGGSGHATRPRGDFPGANR